MDFCEILNLGFLLKFDMLQFSLKLGNLADNLHVYLMYILSCHDRQTVLPVRYELHPEKQMAILNITVEQDKVLC
jgi:hypothetical protein